MECKTATALCVAVLGVAATLGTAAPAVGLGLDEGWSRHALRELVDRVSFEHGLDAGLVDAVVRVESGYDPRAVSRKGALGLMQLMPPTARRLRVSDPFDPEQNVRGGVRELARLVDRYRGNLQLALAAYNAGEGAVQRYRGVPPYSETRKYVVDIMTLYTGKPYRLGTATASGRVPVRVVRDPGSGGVVITNHSRPAVAGSASIATRSGSAMLSGGFGSR